MDMTDFCIVQTTTDDGVKADEIAAALVAERLAACVQIASVVSHYFWKGAPERAQEFLLSIKAHRDDFEAVAAKIRELHDYDLPEIVALPIISADPAYLDWMAEATEKDDD